MVERRHSGATQWLALSCAGDGTVVKVLGDDFGVARAGITLGALVDEGSARKAEHFIAAVEATGFAAGWELDVPAGGNVRSLTFAGLRGGEGLLILAAPASPGMEPGVYEELSRLNNEVINRERELARQNAEL